ncbi:MULTISPECIES: DUF1460 domain-containing protein [unclassified Nocardia]|uniref:DUF1460 domain-containing protein n=1 Tax=unclassified Nocardia TaxID=2637762 RepID=UPI00278C1B47|nr:MULTISPECIES: DUF1460 domain-containing protein [unclassified Nocardia]
MRNIARVLLLLLTLVCGAAFVPTVATAAPALDDTTSGKLDDLLRVRADAGERSTGDMLELLSREFLGTPYRANMLIGSADRPEELVIDFRALDCFTYLDYVTALSRSVDRNQFVDNLIRTRYTDGQVDFAHRKHFFTDWAHTERIAATDITASVSPAAVTVDKHLNAKADGGTYLPGLPVVARAITYIPRDAVDDTVIAGLRTGDYIGAYADAAGLDVTHVGFFVMTPSGPVFRNASSLPEHDEVIDSPFLDYVRTTPGIVVLRPV